jgi:23S rRNA pseudouridine955/2504/2580 synthase
VKHIIGVNPAPPPPQVKTLTVDDDSAGQRLDNYLMRHLKGVPKTHVYRIIRSGEVRVNKGRVGADERVQAGDLVRLPPVRVSERVAEKAQDMATAALAAPARKFVVLFEDEHLLAIDKPAGVAVHGGSGVSFGVIEQLRMARPQAPFLELVHRLDRETSGILLLAKKRSALRQLQDQFRERETGKIYLALVVGQWPANRKVLDKSLHKYLLPDGERRVRVVAKDDPNAMTALTLVKVRHSGDGFSLLEVTIRTGRTHQIRVHLQHEGLTLVGENRYIDTPCREHHRQALHAWRLRFSDGQEPAGFDAPLPPDLCELAARLGLEVNLAGWSDLA